MKRTAVTIVVLSAILTLLSGCAATSYRNAKILSQDQAKIAMTLNENLSGTLINTNTGERIEPCIADIRKEKESLESLIKRCYPKGHDPDGEVLASGTFTLRKGSYCYTGVIGNTLYVFCQPPLNLGFPQ